MPKVQEGLNFLFCLFLFFTGFFRLDYPLQNHLAFILNTPHVIAVLHLSPKYLCYSNNIHSIPSLSGHSRIVCTEGLSSKVELQYGANFI
jgi:hypothetical protein